jgi:hypothetical protein
MRARPLLFLALVSSVIAACGGKVVLDTTSSGTGASGTGGAPSTNNSSGIGATGPGGFATISSSSGGACVNPATDCPSPGTTCSEAICENGACALANTGQGTPCADSGGTVCDGNGNCVGCNGPQDCPATGTLCLTSACEMSTCTFMPAPTGTPCTDSNGKVCNGSGQCVQCAASATACCLQMCETSNVTAYETFVGFELKDCGCMAGGSCASVCTAACADPSTLTGTSPCGMCLTSQTLDEMGSACTTTAGETCIGDTQCAPFVECALACP